ncbi:MAG: N-acetylmuramic acid 6-phosphate etherase [Planctomycetota bacterium]
MRSKKNLTIPNRSHIDTERVNPRTQKLHTLSARGLVALMNRENQAVQRAMQRAAPALARFITTAAPGFLADGRLIYLGAGTSGRLGVLDASEIPPTFCADPGKVIGIIAGGDRSLRVPSEGAEDDPRGALPELRRLRITARDAVLGIAAGGTTPYVHGALTWLRSLPQPPLCALLTCADVPAPDGAQRILLATGPEVLTGSTRLKAGTATKLALNTISTALMTLSGKVYGNLMVDVKATNAKLRDRAVRIVCQLTGITRAKAITLLASAQWSAKTAVVMHRERHDLDGAEQWLEKHGGRLA